VWTEWKDERYYQATVVSTASDSVDVKFADESIVSVRRQNVAKCRQIPIGCTVLARAAESDWYQPAVIQAYYRYPDVESQHYGYTVLFTGQTSHTRYALIVLHCRYQTLTTTTMMMMFEARIVSSEISDRKFKEF